ncbi:hypothetical protein [Candidatus Methylacidithermus pantelleriae]|uniref:Uncharacterized protein n=1 Tax=Candidatus Methylacidithermus pantelleriae TaxID=2744239 RepID=A0A8J2BKG1_9BACT|nr:hypothetical protein [Candidatus Methylacidithermus pantelleriae]CAF0696097.1 hypothetical protein MPNT_20114 [Candidatus Methylacidithermus pantelleriae]
MASLREVAQAGVGRFRSGPLIFFAYPEAIGITQGGFFAGAEVIEVEPAYTSVIGGVNDARRHGTSFSQGAASRCCPERMKVSPNAHRCGRR